MRLLFQVFSGYAIIIVIMTIIMISTHRSINSLIDREAWVKHTHEVISEANHVQKLLIDMETGQRGFVITGKDNFLEPYRTGGAEYAKTLADLQRSVADNPGQVQILQEIDHLVQAWQQEAAIPEIDGRRLVDQGLEPFATVEKMISRETGKILMDRLRSHIHRFITNEEMLLSQRRSSSISASMTTKSIIVSGTLIALFIGIMSVYFIVQNIRGKVGGDPDEINELASLIAGGKIAVPEKENDSNASGILASVISMANDLRQVSEEKDRLRAGLDDAAMEVYTLRAGIPVCSRCKNIRKDEDAWKKLAEYVAHHPVERFSQGICPDCRNKKES